MGQTTENTIVIKKEHQQLFLEEYKQHRFNSGLGNLSEAYDGASDVGDIVVYLFDCNGDNPWTLGDARCPLYINETNYLDGEPPYTEMWDAEGIIESDNTAAALLNFILPETEKEIVTDKIKYTK